MTGRVVRFMLKGPVTPWARPGARAIVGTPKHPGAKPPAWISWYTDADVDDYQKRVMAAFAEACRMQPFFVGPVVVDILVVEPRQQGRMRLKDPQGLIPSVGPKDVDNYTKVTLDGLQRCALCMRSRAGKKGCGCRTPVPMLQDDKLVTRAAADKARAEIAHRRSKRSGDCRLYVRVAELESEAWEEHLRATFPEAFMPDW